jgi:hypothetical protein
VKEWELINITKKKNKNKIAGQFLVLEHEIYESMAFQELTIHAKWLYIEFKYRFNGENRYKIKLPQREAMKIMGINTFIKARNQLIEKGFIDVIQRGGLENQSAIFGLSNRWRKYGKPDFEKRNINDIFPPIFKTRFKKGHKFYGEPK